MKATTKKMRIAAVIIAAIAFTVVFTACKGENKSNSEGRGDLIVDELVEKPAQIVPVNLAGTEWVCPIKNEKVYRELHIIFDGETKFYFNEYKAGDPEGRIYGEGTYKVEGNTIHFNNPSGLLITSMQLRDNTIVAEDESRVYVNIENLGYGDVIENVNLTGTKWVSEFDNGNSAVIVFKTATECEHYFLVEGEEMDKGTNTYNVDGNTVLIQRLGDIDAFDIKGDELIFTAPSSDSMVYKKQK